MDNHYKKYLSIILAVAMSLFLMGCGAGSSDTAEESSSSDASSSSSDSSEITMEDVMEQEAAEEKDYDNGIYFEEEDDGAEIVTVKSSPEDFVGSWEATSGQALYQYGNVDIKIRIDGTWSGNIAEDDLKGKWTQTDKGLHCSSDMFEFTLAFTKDDVLVMQTVPEKDNPEDVIITTVLTKK